MVINGLFTVQALRDIAKTLGKTDWNFNEDPCSATVWVKDQNDAVTCSCSIPNTTGCHVVNMYALSLSLSFTMYCVTNHDENLLSVWIEREGGGVE